MTWIDYAVLFVFGLSILFGVFRGLIRELMSLIGWIAAFALATMFARPVAGMLPEAFGVLGSHVVAFVGILVVVWILSGVLGWFLHKLVKAAGLGWPDRMLGSLFGLARGMIVVLLAVMAAGLTSLPKEAAWREAVLTGPLETAVIALKPILPPALAQQLKYR